MFDDDDAHLNFWCFPWLCLALSFTPIGIGLMLTVVGCYYLLATVPYFYFVKYMREVELLKDAGNWVCYETVELPTIETELPDNVVRLDDYRKTG